MTTTTIAKPKCRAHKKDGTPCGRWPMRGSNVCPKHGGTAPQVRRKAQERIIAAADLAAARLIEFMNDKKVPYNVRLAATRDLLDRSIGPAAQTVKLGLDAAFDDVLADIIVEVVKTGYPRPAAERSREGHEDDAGMLGDDGALRFADPARTIEGSRVKPPSRTARVKVPGYFDLDADADSGTADFS
jgi:hypothetical protein